MEKVRLNVTMSQDLKDWYSQQAELYGISVSAMMAIAMAQYRQSLEGVNAIKDFTSLLDGLKDVQNSFKSSKGVEPVLNLIKPKKEE